MKVFLLNEMIKQGVRKAEMARRLDVHLPQIDRLLDFNHSTKVEFVEKAYGKLNQHFTILLTNKITAYGRFSFLKSANSLQKRPLATQSVYLLSNQTTFLK